jgi:hypothetical protein
MGVDQESIATLRGVFRKDLESVGMVPTGIGIQMVAQEDPALGFGLLCEALYVQLYHDRSQEELVAYLGGPLRVEDERMQRYILKTTLHVRAALVQHGGDHQQAYQQLMRDKGAEKEVVQKVIEACVRTAKEFKIPWNKTYAFADLGSTKSSGGMVGCLVLLGIAMAIVFALYLLVRWIFG